jgi:ATP-dependent DNA helicase DinG
MACALVRAGKPSVRDLLGPGGITREVREPQIRMAELVADALAGRRHALIEAGTGTGKSLGYLVPAMLSGARVVVCTGTITLQEQLVGKDLPWLAEAVLPMGYLLSYGLAKGRGNYLCPRRLDKAVLKARQLRVGAWGDVEPRAALAQLGDALAAGVGDRARLGFVPDAGIWRRVASDPDDCAGKKCAWRAECPYQQARARLADCQIIVANHALVAADLAIDNPETGRPGGLVLPEHDYLVVDEAHHFRDAVFKAATVTLRTGQALRLLLAISEDVPRFDQGRMALAAVAAEDALLAPLARMIGHDAAIGLQAVPVEPVRRYQAALGEVANGLPQTPACEAHRSRIARLQETAEACLEPTGAVVWAELGVRGVELHRGPLNVARILRERLYAWRTVMYTSATLADGPGGFGYAKSEQGLGLAAGPLEGQFDSPFDYPRQCLLYLPGHLPAPTPEQPISRDTLREMWRLVRGTRGRAFLLFASRASMITAWDALAEHMVSRGFPAAKQGDLPMADLVAWFKGTAGAVLFALASFWEGVSIEGPALSLVVIEKIPFPSPAEPVFKAREEACRRAGDEPFNALSLPAATLRLKQGVGRLIRTQTDRGIVAILDPRLTTARYGRRILRALPPCTVTRRFPTDLQFFTYIA